MTTAPEQPQPQQQQQQPPDYPRFLAEARQAARNWLFDDALPLWWAAGADHLGGGFHEQLDGHGQPVGKPARLRVQARQVFVYARAGALGWSGPWKQAMDHGLHFMLQRYRRSDGLFRSTLSEDDERIDLYDQAFVLLAIACGWHAHGRPPELLATASRLMAAIDTRFRLPDGGWHARLVADAPSTPPSSGATPLHANPLMHLLEALLAWVEVGAEAGVDGPFRDRAADLCRLALHRLFDRSTGSLREVAGDGKPPVCEPGHQFEWAFLMREAQRLLSGNDVDLDPLHDAATWLERFGRLHGIDPARGVAVFAIDPTGQVLDPCARLWAQTERLRCALVFASNLASTPKQDQGAQQHAAMQAFDTLQRFLSVPQAGLWHEWMGADGRFELQPSPASSLYHLVTGLEPLLRTTERGGPPLSSPSSSPASLQHRRAGLAESS